MSDSFFDKFIADLVKGAENTEGFMRGGRVTVEVQREPRGREEKLAMDASTMLGGIPGLGPVLGGLSSAAREDNMGTGALTTAGSALGQLGGAAGGAALGGLTDSDRMRLIGALLGQAGGGMLGAAGGRALGEHMSDEPTRGQPMRGKRANLTPGAAGIGNTLARALGSASGAAARHPALAKAAIGTGIGALGGLAGSEEDHRLEGALKGGLVGGGLGLGIPAGARALLKAHPEAFMGGMMPKTALMNPRAAAASVMPGGGPIRSGPSKPPPTPPPIPAAAMKKRAVLEATYVDGARAAAEAFGVKEAAIPIIGGLIAGARALAPRLLGGVKKLFGGGGGIGGDIASAGVQHALAPRQQQQQPQQQAAG